MDCRERTGARQPRNGEIPLGERSKAIQSHYQAGKFGGAPTNRYTYENIAEYVGREIGVSDWLAVEQERIQQFAACTGDHQWIHVDVARAARGPFGTTIAHGYLTLALLSQFTFSMGILPGGIAQAINYGCDRVRFLAPVPAGARIRARATVLEAVEKRPGQLLLKLRFTIEIEGQNRPAMVAETLTLLMR